MQNAFNNQLFEFVCNTEIVDKKTGEYNNHYKKKYRNLSFTFRLDSTKDKIISLTVRGSIHKFYNNGLHNANRLTFKQLTATLDNYEAIFGIDLSKCKLLPLENGTNIRLRDIENYQFNIDDVIQHTICIKRKMYNHNAGIETSLISGTSKNEVRNKFYSKSAEQPKYCNTDTLRIEDKETKTRRLKKENIVMVSDLYVVKNHIKLLEMHLENISNMVIYDYTIQIPRKSKYLKIANELKTSIYWRKLIKDCKTSKEYHTKYNDKVRLLNNLSEKYGTNLLHNIAQQVKKQSLKDLGLCNFSTLEITKKPKNAPSQKPKNARLYIGCNPCDTYSNFHTTLNLQAS